MMTDPSPELIAKVADVIDVRRHAYQVDTDTWVPSCICGWSAEERYSAIAAYARHLAVAVLEAVTPLIAAQAWGQGYAASQQEWRHVYDGHTVEPGDEFGMCTECGQGNPYGGKE